MPSERQKRSADNLPRVNPLRHPGLLLSGPPLGIGAVLFLLAIVIVAFILPAESLGFWLGISVFVAGWLFTAALDMRNSIEQHTFNLLMKTRFTDSFVESLRDISQFLRNNHGKIDANISKNIYSSKDTNDIMLRQHISHLLNFYEILAISVYYKDADEFLLQEYFNDLMAQHYESLKYFIAEWRQHDTEAFVYFEWLVRRWGNLGPVPILQAGPKIKGAGADDD